MRCNTCGKTVSKYESGAVIVYDRKTEEVKEIICKYCANNKAIKYHRNYKSKHSADRYKFISVLDFI